MRRIDRTGPSCLASARRACPAGVALVRESDFDDPVASPLVIERPFGEGKVVLWTSTIDPEWNASITGRPPFVPVMRGHSLPPCPAMFPLIVLL